MKRFRKTKERVLGFALALIMVVSVFTSANMYEVKAEESNAYAPYYDTEQNEVCGAPSIGTRISPTDVFSAENLQVDERLEWVVYYTEEGARNKSEFPGLAYLIFDNQATAASGLGTLNEKYEWIVTNVYFEENVIGDFNKRLVVEGYSVESPTIISPTVSFNWNGLSAFTIGESVPNVEDALVSVTGESIEDTFMLGLQIKATMQHVEAGYITESMYSDAEGGWISANNYSSDYKINKTDVYGYAFELQADDVLDTYHILALNENADIKNNINVTTDGIVVDMAYVYSCYSLCDFAMVYLNLGTGADIEEAINPNTQEPVTPPTTDDKDEPVIPPTTDDKDEPVTPPTTDDKDEPVTLPTSNDHKAQLENKTDVKTKIELTEDEKSAIASGEELEVVLVFTDAGTKVDNDEKKAIEKQLGDNSLGVFLDIELIKKIGSTEVEVSETTGLITITFEMPEELKNKDASVDRTYKVMRYHDGKVDVLDAKYDSKTGKLSFETDKFSTYAIVYSDAKTNSTTTSTPAPQTGDATNTVVYIALLGLALCSVVFVLRKQRKF